MKNTLIITFIAITSSIIAGDYEQFCAPKNQLWVIKTTYPYIEEIDDVYCTYFGTVGDTVINSITYDKIYILTDTIASIEYIEYYLGAIREDAKKAYFILNGDSKERLMFDYSKNVNDTLIIDSTINPPRYVTITKIDTLVLSGIDYRRFWTSCGDKWIEGIGNTEWDIFTVCPPLPDNGSYTRLHCYKLNDKIIYGTSCECDSLLTSVIEYRQNELLSIFPNPVKEFIY